MGACFFSPFPAGAVRGVRADADGGALAESGIGIFFMPAMTARVFNPLLQTFADRLLENGKKPKQIIIAVIRKLLHQIYGILKSGQPYNPEKRGFAGS